MLARISASDLMPIHPQTSDNINCLYINLNTNHQGNSDQFVSPYNTQALTTHLIFLEKFPQSRGEAERRITRPQEVKERQHREQ